MIKSQVYNPSNFLQPSNNLSEVADAATARANLGVSLGTNVQAYDAELAAIALTTSAADKLPYFIALGTAALADFPSFGRSIAASTSAAAARSTLAVTSANQLSVYAAGTAAVALGTVAALIDFSTTDPSLTITAAGTYLMRARALMNYNGATFAASRNTTLKLRRTNNTAADLTNATVTGKTDIVTTLTYTFLDQGWDVIYTTTNADDIIQMFGNLDVVPSAGSLDVAEASIVAVRLQQ